MLIGVLFDHDRQGPVLELPCRGVGHPEMAREFERGDGVFPLSERVQAETLDAQGQLGVGEDRPGAQRDLTVATPARNPLARGQGREALGMPAMRADEALRSGPTVLRLGASLLGAVPRNEIRQTRAPLKLDGVPGHGADSLRRWIRSRCAPARDAQLEPAPRMAKA